MTKPKTEEERITEFATAIYHALSYMKDEDYPDTVKYYKRSLGMLHHSRTTVKQMDGIFQNVVRRLLKKHRLKLVRKMRTSYYPCPWCGKQYMTHKRWKIYHEQKCPKRPK